MNTHKNKHIYSYSIVIYIFIVFSLIGCSSDSDSFNSDQLYQTQWRGTLTYIENDIKEECLITIYFETQDRGRYICENMNELSQYSKQTTIEYNIDGKIITIFGGVYNVILGDWWIVKSNKNELQLSREPNTKYTSTLTLKKL